MATTSAGDDEVQIIVYDYYSTIKTTGSDNVIVNVNNLPALEEAADRAQRAGRARAVARPAPQRPAARPPARSRRRGARVRWVRGAALWAACCSWGSRCSRADAPGEAAGVRRGVNLLAPWPVQSGKRGRLRKFEAEGPGTSAELDCHRARATSHPRGRDESRSDCPRATSTPVAIWTRPTGIYRGPASMRGPRDARSTPSRPGCIHFRTRPAARPPATSNR